MIVQPLVAGTIVCVVVSLLTNVVIGLTFGFIAGAVWIWKTSL